MINFMLPHYMTIHMLIYQEISLANAKTRGAGDAAIDGRDKDRIRQNLEYPLQKATEYGLGTAKDRIERIILKTRAHEIFTYGEVLRQMQALLEAFEDDTKFLYLYCYPRDKVQTFLRSGADWEPALKAFPAISADLDHGMDLYALGHNMACIFHLMRVAEIGVQSLGKKLGVSLTKRSANRLADLTWHQILDALNPKLKAISQKSIAGRAKFEKYSAIQSYLYAVKDAWRNPTMHPRKTGYNELETLNIINQLRSFMNELASVVSQ